MCLCRPASLHFFPYYCGFLESCHVNGEEPVAANVAGFNAAVKSAAEPNPLQNKKVIENEYFICRAAHGGKSSHKTVHSYLGQKQYENQSYRNLNVWRKSTKDAGKHTKDFIVKTPDLPHTSHSHPQQRDVVLTPPPPRQKNNRPSSVHQNLHPARVHYSRLRVVKTVGKWWIRPLPQYRIYFSPSLGKELKRSLLLQGGNSMD